LKELEAKYAVVDRVGKSFGFLAYATIGIFTLFITFGDILKLFKFILLKFKKQTVNSSKNVNVPKQKMLLERKLTKADVKKLTYLEERIDNFRVEVYTANKQRNSK
jgi:hypothetical protein